MDKQLNLKDDLPPPWRDDIDRFLGVVPTPAERRHKANKTVSALSRYETRLESILWRPEVSTEILRGLLPLLDRLRAFIEAELAVRGTFDGNDMATLNFSECPYADLSKLRRSGP